MNSKLILTFLLAFAFAESGCGPTSPKLQPIVPELGSMNLTAKEVKVEVNSKVDMLIVVDNSLSMDVYQRNLANNIDKFINEFQKNGALDFHLGIVPIYDSRKFATKELQEQFQVKSFLPFGELLALKDLPQGMQSPPYLTRDFFNSNPNAFFNTLRKTMFLGTSPGAEFEETFSPVMKALSPEMRGGPNKGFYRDDAYLLLIFITDADDVSQSLSPDRFYRFLLDLKGSRNADKIMTMGVLSPSYEPSCKPDPSNKPYRIERFLEESGGKELSICSKNFGPALANIGIDMSQQVSKRSYIPLTAHPVKDSIQVKYGSQVVKRDSARGWIYNPRRNEVVLSPNLEVVHEEGAQFSIKFDPVEL